MTPRDRPILFSGPMVRAILEGRKTQTRRLCKPMNAWTDQDCREVRQIEEAPHHFLKGASTPLERLHCPYGRSGDRLWVKETWASDGMGGARYYATDAVNDLRKKRPSIFMPRWASRITLEVVAVRVERLHDISEEDALAEGPLRFDSPSTFVSDDGVQSIYFPEQEYARGAYRSLWESINGPGSWAANPWVWVIEFRRIK